MLKPNWLMSKGLCIFTSESGFPVGCVESSERTGRRSTVPEMVRSEDSTHPTLLCKLGRSKCTAPKDAQQPTVRSKNIPSVFREELAMSHNVSTSSDCMTNSPDRLAAPTDLMTVSSHLMAVSSHFSGTSGGPRYEKCRPTCPRSRPMSPKSDPRDSGSRPTRSSSRPSDTKSHPRRSGSRPRKTRTRLVRRELGHRLLTFRFFARREELVATRIVSTKTPR